MTVNLYWIAIGVIVILSVYEFFLTKIDSFYLFIALGAFLGGSIGHHLLGWWGIILGAVWGAWLLIMLIVLTPILFLGFLACNKECRNKKQKFDK